MAEIIRVNQKSKKKEIEVKVVQPKKAPNLPKTVSTQFKQEAIEKLEDRLLYLGIVIPKGKLKMLAPALVKIGKKYYEAVDTTPLF